MPRYATLESNSLQRIDGEDRVVTSYVVYVVEGEKAQQRKLEVSYADHLQMAVSSGLRAGEQLVVSGQANLRDGSPVIVAQKEGAAL